MQSTISSGCTKSLAQNSLSLGYCTCTLYSDSITACVIARHCCNIIRTHSTGNCTKNWAGLHTIRDRTVVNRMRLRAFPSLQVLFSVAWNFSNDKSKNTRFEADSPPPQCKSTEGECFVFFHVSGSPNCPLYAVYAKMGQLMGDGLGSFRPWILWSF